MNVKLSTTFKRLMEYIKPQSKLIFGIISCIIGTTVGILIATRMIGILIDEYILKFDINGLFIGCSIMMVIYIITSILTWLQEYWLLLLAQNTVTNIRKDIFEKFQKLPLSYFDKTTLGELMSRVTNDVDNISNAINTSLSQIFSSVLTLSTTLIMMIYLNITLTLTTLISIPLVLIITKIITSKSKKLFKDKQEKMGMLNGHIEEVISGQKVVKTFSRETEIIEEFSDYNQKLMKAGIPAEIYASIIYPLVNSVTNISYVMVVTVGTVMILDGVDGVTVGLISNFVLYARQYTKPINELASQINALMSAFAGCERVFEVLDADEEVADSKNDIEIDDVNKGIVFENVNFSYDKKVQVLQDINLDIKKGETIALVGATGAGKSTIIQLLNRFYDIDSGEIKVDGQNINDIRRRNLRSKISIVLQDTYLFSGTIKENILYGRLDATDKEIEEAVKLANAYDFINKLPLKMDFMLIDGGTNLSQGQRQMLAIARAILANPSILILDEATSNVDTKTEKKIQEGMKNLMKGRTNFVIAHRLSTIRDADLIAVVNDGKIMESGNHNQLMAEKGYYFKMYTNQIGGAV